MNKRRLLYAMSIIFVISVGIALLPKAISYTDKLRGDYGGDGSIKGEASITLFGENNEVISGSLIQFFSGISPEIREELLWCRSQAGMEWIQDPYGEGGYCVPVPPPPDPVEPETPPKDTQPIPTEEDKYERPPPPPVVKRTITASKVVWFKFKLEWVEVQARNIDQSSLRVIMKVRGLLNNGEWSSVIEDEVIKASDNEFKFTKIDEERWKARADSSTMKDQEVGINVKDQFRNKFSEKIPVTFFSYYYATAQSSLDGEIVESEHIEQVTEIRDSSLTVGGGLLVILDSPVIRRLLK